VRACPRDDRAEGRRSRPLPSATTPQGRHAQRRGRSSDAQIALFLERACHRARDRMPSGKGDADALCPLPQRHRDATPRGEGDRATPRLPSFWRGRATEPGTGCPLERATQTPSALCHNATGTPRPEESATELGTDRHAQIATEPQSPGPDATPRSPQRHRPRAPRERKRVRRTARRASCTANSASVVLACASLRTASSTRRSPEWTPSRKPPLLLLRASIQWPSPLSRRSPEH